MKLRLVHASHANRFMRDILEGIAAEACFLGVEATVVDDVFSTEQDTAHVVIPHEYFATTEPSQWPDKATLGRTIALGVEHPGTGSFEVSATQSQRCGAIIDVNRDSISELSRRGITAHPFQLGYTPQWDRWHGNEISRDIDVAYLGSTDARRDQALASFAPLLWNRNCRIYVPTPEPNPGDQTHYVVGERKFELLARTKILINMHRLDSTALEWVRVIESISNGCIVVSEHSTDCAPLVPQQHFLSGHISNLGILAVGKLNDPGGLRAMRGEAYEFLRSELPMRPSVERLISLAEDLISMPRHAKKQPSVPTPQIFVPPAPGWQPSVSQDDFLAAAVRRMETQLTEQQRAISRLGLGLKKSEDSDEEIYRTPSFDQLEPRISVIITCHNYASEIIEALDSVNETGNIDIEVLIYDDASTDNSVHAVSEYLHSHPHLPAKLIHGRVNKGLATARNDLITLSRGKYVFILDADNGIYPTALNRLADALESDPDASFAYCIIAAFRAGKAESLVSAQSWQPSRLRRGNYIDAMAMLKREDVLAIGGYDPKMTEWEDFHLWARMAENEMHGSFVPEILAWYRLTHHSMSMKSGINNLALWSRIRRSAPTIMHD